jgi:hypothetical protein
MSLNGTKRHRILHVTELSTPKPRLVLRGSFFIFGQFSMKRLELSRSLLKRLTEVHYLLHDRRDTPLCFSAYEIVKFLFRHHGMNLHAVSSENVAKNVTHSFTPRV